MAACAQVFPIVLSEFGSALNERTELDCFTSITDYVTSTGLANDGRHAPIQSWFYWWGPCACLPLPSLQVFVMLHAQRRMAVNV